MVEESHNTEFSDLFNQMQFEDDDTGSTHADPHPQFFHSGSSGAVQAILASGSTAPTISMPSPIHELPHTTNNHRVSDSIVQDIVDRSLQAVAAPSKSKTCPKPKPKNVPATKKAKNPQVDVDGRPGAVVDDFIVITGNELDSEVAADGQPARRTTRGRKGKSRAVL